MNNLKPPVEVRLNVPGRRFEPLNKKCIHSFFTPFLRVEPPKLVTKGGAMKRPGDIIFDIVGGSDTKPKVCSLKEEMKTSDIARLLGFD